MPPRSLALKAAFPSSTAEWKALSQRLASYEILLNLTGIESLSDPELDALLSAVPREWDHAEYERVIDMDSLSPSMDDSLYQAIKRRRAFVLPELPAEPPTELSPKPPVPSSAGSRWNLLRRGAILALVAVATFPLFKTYTFLSGHRFSQPQVVIGAVNSGENYATLKTYLEQNLIPDNFWSHLRGDRVRVVIDAGTPERDLAYPRAISLVNDHSWDVAFAYSPIVGMAAEDVGYQAIAIMFPGEGRYQASIFVKRNSPIQSLDGISEKYTIALGDFFSASKFYMPSYELYGKRLTVLSNIPSREIFDLVRKGQVDIGVGVLTQPDPELRVLKQSRDIPGSGVYLSPQLTASDAQVLKTILLNAPDEIKSRKQANYDEGEKLDSEYFRGIVQRVREITACSDFRRNPVDFYCSSTETIVNIEGRINGIEQKGNHYFVIVNQFNGQTCSLHLTNETLRDLSVVDNVFELQGYYADVIAALPRGTQCTKQSPIEILQPNQIELSRKPKR